MLKCGLSKGCLELITLKNIWTKQTSWDWRVPAENAAYTVSELKKKKKKKCILEINPGLAHRRFFSSLIPTATKGRASPFGEGAAAAAAAAKSFQSCLTLCDPTDGRPPGSPVPGILQARTLE